MRITLCTIRDLTGCLILNALLPRLKGHEVTIALANRKRAVDVSTPTLAELWFLEREVPVDTVFPLIEAANLPTTGRRLTFQELAAAYGAPLDIFATTEEWDGGRPLLRHRPDVVFSSRFSFLMAADMLAAVPNGCFNLHPSALPAFPGQFPVLRAMTSGSPTIGAALHRTTPGIDDGPIAARGAVRRTPDRSHFWHRWAAYRVGVDGMLDVVDRLSRGVAIPAEAQEKTGEKPGAWPDEAEFAAAMDSGIAITGRAEILGCLHSFAPSLLPAPDPGQPVWDEAEIDAVRVTG